MNLELGRFRKVSEVGFHRNGKGGMLLLSSLDRSSLAFLIDGSYRPICMECDVGNFLWNDDEPGSKIFRANLEEDGRGDRSRSLHELKTRIHDQGVKYVFARAHNLVWCASEFTVLDWSLRRPILKKLREREAGLQIPSLNWKRCR